MEYEIPRFILQPIVENAFKYGFRNNKLQGEITISAKTLGKHLYIVVEDNGEGIERERLEYIRRYLNDQTINMNHYLSEGRRGIGLYNVNSRIKLCYGDDYGLQIESQKEKGQESLCEFLEKPWEVV